MKQALVLLIFLTLTANIAEKPVPVKAVERARKAANVLELAMAKPDARIPKALLAKAVAVAVITDMKQVGFLIESGGEGYGVVTRRFSTGKWRMNSGKRSIFVRVSLPPSAGMDFARPDMPR